MATELEQIKQMLRDHMETSKQQHQELTKQMNKVSISVLGDEELGIDGMIKRVQKLEKSESNRKKRDWISIGAAAGTGATSGWFITWLHGIFNK